jgi:hypothetical protein
MENSATNQDYLKDTPEKLNEEKTGILERTDFLLRKLSSYLGHKLNQLSGKGKIFLLLMFFACGFGFSLRTLVQSIWGEERTTQLRVPEIPAGEKVLLQRQNEPLNLSTSDNDYQMIIKFRRSLDSLKQSPEGGKEYQRFLNVHPGLLDSINHVLHYYELQKIK